MIITRYIGKTVINTICIVILILSGLVMFSELTSQFSSIGTGDFGWLQVMQYVLLLLPQDVYLLFPMAGLLGSLIGLGILSGNSELTVMRASGMSTREISNAVLKAALLLTVIMVVIGEVLAPMAQHKAMLNKSSALSGGQAIVTNEGLWLHNQNNFIHVDVILPDGHLKAILRYEFDKDSNLRTASYAQDGIYDHGIWTFKDVIVTKFVGNHTTREKYAEQQWNLAIRPNFLGFSSTDPEQKSLLELSKYIKYLQTSSLNSDRYKFIFWQRFFQPLAILVMIFLSVPFVLGFLRSKPMGIRIVVGTLVGFGFYLINQFVGPLTVVYRLPAIAAALLPILIFAGIGWIMVRKLA